jgi:long-chain-fatty-acid--CoA ligase ACSBG
MEKMQEIGRQTTGFKKSIAEWAKSKGLEGNYAIQRGDWEPWGWWLANQLVFNKVKDALGLDRTRYCATAAAPISKETLDFFLSLNIPIFEIYGMSESTGPQTINRPKQHKTTSCGPAMPGSEMKIANPDKEGNGEICYRGRHIFMGYMKNDKATAETIDDEGWLHSGDIGKMDAKAFLFITGRIKELIITAGGENIPPVLIEDEIKMEIGKVISNVMAVGDRKKFLTCLVTLKAKPNAEAKPGDYPFSDDLADSAIEQLAKGGSSAKTVQEAMKDPKVSEYIKAGIERANKRAASNAQRIQKFAIIPKDFTLEGGELTPTMKLKRRVVVQQCEKEIEDMYAAAAE